MRFSWIDAANHSAFDNATGLPVSEFRNNLAHIRDDNGQGKIRFLNQFAE
jgi:hypothetical protein